MTNSMIRAFGSCKHYAVKIVERFWGTEGHSVLYNDKQTKGAVT